MAISTADFKNGMCIEFNGKLCTIVEFQHVKPGKGSAFVRTKLRDIKTGRIIDNTFNAGVKVESVRLETKKLQYLYNDGADFNFMDNDTFEQMAISTETVGDAAKWLKENDEASLLYAGDELISIEPQMFVEAAAGAPGRATALRATRYLLDGSASAMETLLALLLYLPNNLGGYGLKKPKLNYRVDAPASLRELADRSYCLCDLCWPEANLAVEYDSRLHHSEPGRQSSDARRRSTLIALGFTVITVFPGHITDSGTFNRLARQVAKLTGKRLRYHDPEFTRKHLELREQLLENLWEGARA